MIQPNKDKKKANGTPVAGTTPIEKTTREIETDKKIKANIDSPKGRENIKAIHGIEKKEPNREFKGNAYEKKYIPGDRAKGVKSRVVDGSGKVISEEMADSDKDKEMKRKYVVRKKDTESRREANADFYNFKDKEKEGEASKRRSEIQEFRDKQQADIKDKEIEAKAQLLKYKAKRGQ